MRGSWLAWMTLVAILPLQCAVSAGEPDDTGRIAGRVGYWRSGDALPLAPVFLVGTHTGAVTDMDGHYCICNVRPGRYSVRARYMGFEDATRTDVEVLPGETTVVDFALVAWLRLDPDTVDFGPDSLLGVVSPPLEVRLTGGESPFEVGGEICLDCEIENISFNSLFLIRPPFRERDPIGCTIGPANHYRHELEPGRYRVFLVNSVGDTFHPRVLSCAASWCWDTVGGNFKLLRPGEIFRPFGERLKIEDFWGKMPPGEYQVTLRFQSSPEAAKDAPEPVLKHMVDCDITAEPVKITVLGK